MRYPEAKRLVITADGGGSNGFRLRLWKRELQRLANELGIEIAVSHFPPGISKWNKIEHRLFSFISQNWRARPLVSYRVIVNTIAATTTRSGLSVHCELDPNRYPKGIVVTDEEIAANVGLPAAFALQALVIDHHTEGGGGASKPERKEVTTARPLPLTWNRPQGYEFLLYGR